MYIVISMPKRKSVASGVSHFMCRSSFVGEPTALMRRHTRYSGQRRTARTGIIMIVAS
jgi:hypothetical protein